MEDSYTYETKCRRCGNFTEWHFAPKTAVKWDVFFNAIQDYINSPSQYDCKTCGKKTVQDVVSFTPLN